MNVRNGWQFSQTTPTCVQNQLDVYEQPTVLFRACENTWLEAIVRYLVHPKEAGKVRTDLTRKLLVKLNAAPDRVLFPKSNTR